MKAKKVNFEDFKSNEISTKELKVVTGGNPPKSTTASSTSTSGSIKPDDIYSVSFELFAPEVP